MPRTRKCSITWDTIVFDNASSSPAAYPASPSSHGNNFHNHELSPLTNVVWMGTKAARTPITVSTLPHLHGTERCQHRAQPALSEAPPQR